MATVTPGSTAPVLSCVVTSMRPVNTCAFAVAATHSIAASTQYLICLASMRDEKRWSVAAHEFSKPGAERTDDRGSCANGNVV